MKKSNFAVIEELKVMLRQMDRLLEGFRIEKEEAVQDSGTEPLEKLRRRAQSYYRMKLAGFSREILRLRHLISADLPAREEAEDLAETCRQRALELDAHLVSTPSRLLRARREASSADEI
ncbi:MAG: hypothetical protein JXA64_00330 [Candidatus Fermentibacteraceae bacterium]|nr:hypothetical protein [Candidatus Fermentibacteraceae bacterium]MBN2607531.1 hypothetical protein [Candidatus Fermentibacteraceae bacterium]